MKRGSFEIVKLPASRWEDYRSLRLEAMQSDPKAFGSSYEEELAYNREVWEGRIGNMLFALHNGKPVGMTAYLFRTRLKTRHIADIFSVYVSRDYRGKGIGDSLLKKTLSVIRENKNIRKVSLTVAAKQDAAVGLYKKNGFAITGKLKKELKINNMYYDELVMERFI